MINDKLNRYTLACKISEEYFNEFKNWLENDLIPQFLRTGCFEEIVKITTDKKNLTILVKLYFLNESLKIGIKEHEKSDLFIKHFEPQIDLSIKEKWDYKKEIFILKNVGYIDQPIIKIKKIPSLIEEIKEDFYIPPPKEQISIF